MYLEKINSPSDIKSYSLDEMKELAKEMRTARLKKLSIHGGHCGPNARGAQGQVGRYGH